MRLLLTQSVCRPVTFCLFRVTVIPFYMGFRENQQVQHFKLNFEKSDYYVPLSLPVVCPSVCPTGIVSMLVSTLELQRKLINDNTFGMVCPNIQVMGLKFYFSPKQKVIRTWKRYFFQFMILLEDGSSEHVAHVWRKYRSFPNKNSDLTTLPT